MTAWTWTLGCIVFYDTCESKCHPASDSKKNFHKTLLGQNDIVPFRALSQRSFFFNVYCLFHQRFSDAYLLKLFLLPQCAHTTLFIRCDNPELTRWCLCSLYAGMLLQHKFLLWLLELAKVSPRIHQHASPQTLKIVFRLNFIYGYPQAFFDFLWVLFQRNPLLWVNSNN